METKTENPLHMVAAEIEKCSVDAAVNYMVGILMGPSRLTEEKKDEFSKSIFELAKVGAAVVLSRKVVLPVLRNSTESSDDTVLEYT